MIKRSTNDKMRKFFKVFRPIKFIREEKGAVLILFAVALPVILSLMATVYELSRMSYINAKLSYAADAAAVAALRYGTNSATTNATNIFYANFANGYWGVNAQPTISLSNNNTVVTVTVQSTLTTVFTKFVGVTNLPVGAISSTEIAYGGLELAMVLDVTGSMAWSGKIQALQNAANNLVSTLYQNNTTRPNTAISIIPFVATVNVGTSNWKFISGCSSLLCAPLVQFPASQPWQGCLNARTTGSAETDDSPPSAGLWSVYYTPSTLSLHSATVAWDNDWALAANGSVQIVNHVYDGPNGNQDTSIGPNRSCGPPIVPLVNNSITLQNAIAGLTPIYGGGTFGNLGIAWGWRTISPQWANVWSASSITPKPYNTNNNQKVIIFMTDGINDWYDAPNFPPVGDPTAYGRISGNALGISQPSQARAAIDQQFANLCTSIKAQGITIYTLLFMGGDHQAVNLLQNCASQPSYFYNATTTDAIVTYFNDIANQLNNITIIK